MSKARGFFITATDTGVGKTVVAAALIRAMNGLGIRTGGMKPVETGCMKDGDVLIPSDGTMLKSVAHMNENLNIITPVTFKSPLAPLAATEIEGKEVSLDGIMKSFRILSEAYDALVVEGIGGLLAPVSKDYFVADMARSMDLPVIVVARPSLGTINHTLLTIHYARIIGLDVAGYLVNYASEPENDLAEETNPHILQTVTDVAYLGSFPFLSDFEEDTLNRAAAESLDMDHIGKYLA